MESLYHSLHKSVKNIAQKVRDRSEVVRNAAAEREGRLQPPISASVLSHVFPLPRFLTPPYILTRLHFCSGRLTRLPAPHWLPMLIVALLLTFHVNFAFPYDIEREMLISSIWQGPWRSSDTSICEITSRRESTGKAMASLSYLGTGHLPDSWCSVVRYGFISDSVTPANIS